MQGTKELLLKNYTFVLKLEAICLRRRLKTIKHLCEVYTDDSRDIPNFLTAFADFIFFKKWHL